MTLYGIVDEQDCRELHQATQSSSSVDVRAHVTSSQSQTIVATSNNKPAVAQNQRDSVQFGRCKQGHYAVLAFAATM